VAPVKRENVATVSRDGSAIDPTSIRGNTFYGDYNSILFTYSTLQRIEVQ